MKKILVIDDEEEILEFCKQVLEKEYTVTVTESGKDGLEKIKQELFDLILLDLRLQNMDGMDVLEKIKMSFPWRPVIVMSSYTTLSYQRNAENLGASDYLIKPLKAERLLESIKKTIR